MSRIVILRPVAGISLPLSARFLWLVLLMGVAVVMSGLVALHLGYGQTGWHDIAPAIFSPEAAQSDSARLIATLRLPRFLAALLAGALLALAGCLLQNVARNGLADPGVLGLSDGAVVAVLMLALILPTPSGLAQMAAGFAGAIVVAGLVLGLGWHFLAGGGIVLVGLALNILLGAVVDMVLASGTMAEFSYLQVWQRGTLAGADMSDAGLLAATLACLVPLALVFGRALPLMALGATQARVLGMRSLRDAIALTLIAAIATAAVVATLGPVTFVGLMSTHLARRLVGDRPGEVLFIAMPIGGLLLIWADTIGRMLFAPRIIPAGIVISVLGVLAFVALALSMRSPKT